MIDRIAKIAAAYKSVDAELNKLEEFEQVWKLKNPEPDGTGEEYRRAWSKWSDKLRAAFQEHDPVSDAVLEAHFAKLRYLE